MSERLARLHDDQDTYEYLCDKYGEEMQWKCGRGPDCYSEHGARLAEWDRLEKRAQEKRKLKRR